MLIEDISFNQNAWAPALHLLHPPVAVVEPKQPAEDRDRRRPPRVAPGPAVRLVPSAAPAEAKRGTIRKRFALSKGQNSVHGSTAIVKPPNMPKRNEYAKRATA